MRTVRNGSILLALLASGGMGGLGGWLLAALQMPGHAAPGPQHPIRGYVQNGRFIADEAPLPPDPAAQRAEMIASLHGIEKQLEAIERHARMTYVLLGNQSEESPNEKKR